MSKKLRIKRTHHNRRHIHVFTQCFDLRLTRPQKMRCMMLRRGQGLAPVVPLLIRGGTRDTVIFQTRKTPMAITQNRF